jgi:hypothetical protein
LNERERESTQYTNREIASRKVFISSPVIVRERIDANLTDELLVNAIAPRTGTTIAETLHHRVIFIGLDYGATAIQSGTSHFLRGDE